MKKYLVVIFFLAIAFGFSYESVVADGIIIPDPPICDSCPIPHPMSQLSIRYHHVTVCKIYDSFATGNVTGDDPANDVGPLVGQNSIFVDYIKLVPDEIYNQ